MSNTSLEALSINKAVTDAQIPNQVTESQIVTSKTNRKKREVRKCSECVAIGHNRRTCPKLGKEQRKNQN